MAEQTQEKLMSDERADTGIDKSHPYFRRWLDAPGDDEFEKWFFSMMRYYHRRVDPEVRGLYKEMLGHIPIDELDAVFKDHIMQPDVFDRDPPKVGLLYAKWKRRKEEQNRKRANRRSRSEPEERPHPLRTKLNLAITANLVELPEFLKLEHVPDWIQTIAEYAGQRYREEHPDGEMTEAIARKYYTLAYDLFDAEVQNHEAESGRDPGPTADPVG